MKVLIVFALVCATLCAYGETTSPGVARPPHKIYRSTKSAKTKKVKIHGYDRAWTIKKVRYRKGFNYYSYANRPSYLRMMGKAINGDKYFR
jgi:hypothetical protein